ncbi:PspC domain-containing protein [Cohnella sp. REN36]|uniref:PspC domain-containing protein n=1 Tax=Cohnella sp. REN36 TaxID=2887347 RepID=UPI001D156CC3|nr:PspC domain-containing protein [Cohnella sp. REN36]MCC3377029.1 PspC domain-containing protein [Cohnella sp. REN36]
MRKLYRSTRDRKLFGVCGGLSEYLGVDATLLRILLIIIAVFSAGSVVFVYIIAGFVIPREPYGGPFSADPFGTAGGWRPAQGGWTPPPQQNTPPAGSAWNPNPPSWSGPRGHDPASAARPAARPAAANAPAPELDAMMEDIEKKALKKEIEDLKARITKFEQQSKGE